MRASPRVVLHLKDMEELRLKAYRRKGDPRWTCGWGHTRMVTPNTVTTPYGAEIWLREDVASAERDVDHALMGINGITQGQYDALVDFVFNFGATKFGKSTLLWCIRNGEMEKAASELLRWVHNENGEVEGGLVKRRAIDHEWFTEHAKA